MTSARSLLVAIAAVALLIGARPTAGDGQFPRGLMAAAPRAASFCTIDTRPLSFGAYDPLAGTELDAIGQIIYTCGSGNEGGGPPGRGGGPPPGRGGGPGQQAPTTGIRIEMAQGYSNSFAERLMISGYDQLRYNIYLDATHRTVWGTGEGTTQYYYDANPPDRTPVIVPAFGRIFGIQDVQAGQYTDVVAVRILF